MNVLTSAGMDTRSACGSTIRIVDVPVGKPDAGRSLVLPFRDRLQSAANDLGQVGGDDHDERHLRPQQLVDRQRPAARTAETSPRP